MTLDQGYCPLIKAECRGVVCNFYYYSKEIKYRGCYIVKWLKKVLFGVKL